MTHKDALLYSWESDPDNHSSSCGGELKDPRLEVSAGIWRQVFNCSTCGAEIATVEGRRHWWNHLVGEMTL